MTISEITQIVATVLAGIYVPVWLFAQKKKNDQNEELLNRLQSLEVLLARIDTKIEDHDRRLNTLERA